MLLKIGFEVGKAVTHQPPLYLDVSGASSLRPPLGECTNADIEKLSGFFSREEFIANH